MVGITFMVFITFMGDTTSHVFCFSKKIVFPVHAGVLVPQNRLVTQIMAALVRLQELHVAGTARADRQ